MAHNLCCTSCKRTVNFNTSSEWLGWKDSNLRVPESKSGALTNLATAHHLKDKIIHSFEKKTRPFAVFNKVVVFLYQSRNKTKQLMKMPRRQPIRF